MFAVYKGVLQAASFLLEKGLSGMFALKYITKVTIDLGAEVSSRDINGLNIIHYAVDSNILENVQFSVNTNLAIDEQDNNGWTPLMRALMLQCKPEILEYLLLNGASTEIRDKNGFDFKKHLKISKFVQQLHFLTFLKK
ncbi:hypothetical protein ABEB36_013336 [Hypothenemus hampei]|uniref:Uncharacterized protein n=1 Tax=Hypothenemus hampei TaxID=57062 RepID=A0ABD1E8J0_HYPHA